MAQIPTNTASASLAIKRSSTREKREGSSQIRACVLNIGRASQVEGKKTMKTVDSWDVIQGDEECRDGHYRAKQDLRAKTVTSSGADLAVELDPNDSTSLQAQNPTDLGKLRIGVASEEAAGIPAIWNTMLYGIGEMGPIRSSEAFLEDQPGNRVRLPELRMAESRQEAEDF